MADQKITQLTADATPTSDDLVVLVNDPAGTPGNKKATLADLATALAGMSGLTGAFAPAATRGCRVYRSAALSIANNDQTPIAWDAESFDTNTLHDNSTNPSRVLLNKVGKWLCTWELSYSANATGVRDASLALNGSIITVREDNNNGASVSTYISGVDVVVATATTDYVEVWPFQNSGASRALSVGSTTCFLSVVFLGT